MRKKTEKIRLASLANIDIDTIVEAHIELVTTPITTVTNWKDITCDKDCASPILEVVKEAKAAPRKAILYHKYAFLIHTIIMHCRANKKNQTHLDYKQMTDILGHCYGDMLYNLENMDIITMTSAYNPGVESRTISLNDWTIKFIESTNVKVLEYIRKNKQLISKCKTEAYEQFKDDEFVKRYNESLSYLELIKRNEAIDYIHTRTFDSLHSYHYYISRIEEFDKNELKIISIDKNERIYHYFTNLPKSLKSFFNIKYQLDISNSHPLLFSYYLIKHYDIDNNILNILYNISIDTYNKDHNVCKQLCKSLNIKKIDVPNDVLQYIYVTSKGRFWDDFVETFKAMERGEVKATLFREVFYSRSTTTRKKPFGKVFVEQYPNVWKLIRRMKKRAKLPNLMMKFESHLFRSILTECFKRGWKVASIHDAIIVPNVEANANIHLDELRNLMIDIYRTYNLNPSISIDIY